MDGISGHFITVGFNEYLVRIKYPSIQDTFFFPVVEWYKKKEYLFGIIVFILFESVTK